MGDHLLCDVVLCEVLLCDVVLCDYKYVRHIGTYLLIFHSQQPIKTFKANITLLVICDCIRYKLLVLVSFLASIILYILWCANSIILLNLRAEKAVIQ